MLTLLKSATCQARDVLTCPIITGSVWLPGPGVVIILVLKVLILLNRSQIISDHIPLITVVSESPKHSCKFNRQHQ